MIETIIILAAMFARYLQGNGFAGPGRWLLLPIMLLAGWWGPLNGQHLSVLETACIAAMAGWGWANVAFGYTKWESIPYSLFRYEYPLLLGTCTAVYLTGRSELLPYLLAGPALALNYYYVSQHKPQWLSRVVGNRDIAAPIAGGIAASLVFL